LLFIFDIESLRKANCGDGKQSEQTQKNISTNRFYRILQSQDLLEAKMIGFSFYFSRSGVSNRCGQKLIKACNRNSDTAQFMIDTLEKLTD